MRGRYITEQERIQIKEARERERQYQSYMSGAVQRMQPKKTNFRMKVYKEKY